ncbi:hypothetical protein SAMN04489724_1052 [Algoriphagus locisalis]|uniref:Uncharacterized protein n=1 Tax=Algoriphagus locisalis TaxID=305507 RepID=A0A1I6YK03_9BACT|nr:hypothetical protein [Algoriphagus locisalis]SFT50677.1 hypothetical protein SAMN04489724_1052 [Algoriphagus locisalis]
MKKSLVVLIALISSIYIWSGCSSGDENPTDNEKSIYYFRFKIEGQLVEYPYQPETQINLTGGKYYDGVNQLHIIQLSGTQNIYQSLKNQVVFHLGHTEDFTTGITYSNLASEDVVTLHTFLFGYHDENGKNYIATKNSAVVSIWDEVTIEFSQIDASGLKGTFSGTGKSYDSSSGQNILNGSVQITDGEFYVPRNNEL